MTVDARAALEQLIAALERHFESATSYRDPDHPMVVAAAQDLAEAFDDYDEALFDATEVATPLAIFGDDLDVADDESDTDGVYAGLDSDEYDESDDDDDDDDDESDDFDDDDDEDDDDEDDDEDDDDEDDDESDDESDEDDDSDDFDDEDDGGGAEDQAQRRR